MSGIGGIIWLIIICSIVFKTVKANGEAAKRGNNPRQQLQKQLQEQYQAKQQQMAQQINQRQVTAEDRAKLENYRQKKGSNAYVPSQPVQPNQELNKNQQRMQEQPSIVERAKANSKKYASSDVTLETLESEHNHTEKVSSAVADYVVAEREAHKKMHEEQRPRVEEESLLGSVEDLMIKGYDGNLSFERDFIGEASDFLAKLTL